MDLIVVRHALPERRDGDAATADPPLSEVGRRQAAVTSDFLSAEQIDHIVASPLRRAIQTAEPLARRLGIEIELIEGLREIDPFRGAYVPVEEMTQEHPVAQDFLDDWRSLFVNEGGYEAFRSVVLESFGKVIAANRGRRVAAFCHGTVIGTYLTTLLGSADPFALLPDYCGLCRLKAASNGMRTLRSVNETGHVRELLG
jgi:probable phosphoglycerate mutase